ncbi:hypothetical protein BaRGS_00026450, partial [Batillaria attramentaria]
MTNKFVFFLSRHEAIQEKRYATPEEMEEYNKRMMAPTLPNSQFKEKPELKPEEKEEKESFEEALKRKARDVLDEEPVEVESQKRRLDSWVTNGHCRCSNKQKRDCLEFSDIKKLPSAVSALSVADLERASSTKLKPPVPAPSYSIQRRLSAPILHEPLELPPPKEPTPTPQPEPESQGLAVVSSSAVPTKERQSIWKKVKTTHDIMKGLNKEQWFHKTVAFTLDSVFDTLVEQLDSTAEGPVVVKVVKDYLHELARKFKFKPEMISKAVDRLMSLVNSADVDSKLAILDLLPDLHSPHSKMLPCILRLLCKFLGDKEPAVQQKLVATLKRYGVQNQGDLLARMKEVGLVKSPESHTREISLNTVAKRLKEQARAAKLKLTPETERSDQRDSESLESSESEELYTPYTGDHPLSVLPDDSEEEEEREMRGGHIERIRSLQVGTVLIPEQFIMERYAEAEQTFLDNLKRQESLARLKLAKQKKQESRARVEEQESRARLEKQASLAGLTSSSSIQFLRLGESRRTLQRSLSGDGMKG